MTQQIVNGAGMVLNLGTDDRSTRVVPVAPEQVPQHLPMIFIFAKRGTGKHLVGGAAANKIFHDETFDPRGAYFNHATAYAKEAIANGNACMIKRLVPTDAGPKANAILWLDILETTVDRYRRNPDGSIYLDELGEPEVTGTTPGLKAKWVKTKRTTVVDQELFGNKTQTAGDQTDSGTSTNSVRYPMFEIEESSQGDDGNNTGFRLWAPTTEGGGSLPKAMMAKSQKYPYMFSVVSRKDSQSVPTLEKTLTGETQVMFTFDKGVVNPVTSQQLSYDQILLQSYNLIDVPNYPNVYGRIGRFFVYEESIAAVRAKMYEFEADFITSNSDITEDEASMGLLNFVTGVSSSGVPYESFTWVDSPTSVRMSQSNSVYLDGGNDGTMTNEMYEELVEAEMDKYGDANDPVQNMAVNVESWLYDSGFSLQTKLKLAQFISVRKNTVAVFGTHVAGEAPMTAAEEHSVAISIRNRLQMYPESEYFGTPVARAMIMGRSGLIRDSEYSKRLPMTFEIISKFSSYMGAGNGKWKSGFSPEGNPNNLVNRMKNINITWLSNLARNQDWDVGLNWVLSFDRQRLFIPAYKTVYSDDTSVLNSIITAGAIAELNTIANRAWAMFTGRSDLSGPQLCDRVNAYVRQEVNGKFDNRFIIIPDATITDLDDLRGFSWSLPIKIGADNMRTVMTTWVESYRKSDLVPTSTSATGG